MHVFPVDMKHDLRLFSKTYLAKKLGNSCRTHSWAFLFVFLSEEQKSCWGFVFYIIKSAKYLIRRNKNHNTLNCRYLFYSSVYKSQNLMHTTHHTRGNRIHVTHCRDMIHQRCHLSHTVHLLPGSNKQPQQSWVNVHNFFALSFITV